MRPWWKMNIRFKPDNSSSIIVWIDRKSFSFYSPSYFCLILSSDLIPVFSKALYVRRRIITSDLLIHYKNSFFLRTSFYGNVTKVRKRTLFSSNSYSTVKSLKLKTKTRRLHQAYCYFNIKSPLQTNTNVL